LAPAEKNEPEMTNHAKPVVVTLHGIRTRGEWQKRIAPKIARYGMIPVLLDYGYLNLVQFLNPWTRDKLVKWLRDEISAVRRDYPESPISVVAHSLGTYLVARLLEEESSFTFETVLFSGSIVAREYDWKRLLSTNRVQYVANYIAEKDVWPKLAELVIKGAGRAGTEGFTSEHPALFQHAHAKYGHSDYFSPHTFEVLWLPKLVLPQRQMRQNLYSLLVQVTKVLKTEAAASSCLVRTRLFYRPKGEASFLQFPGMYVASGEHARYQDEELEYVLTPEATRGAIMNCPPAFQAIDTGKTTSWISSDEEQFEAGRADVLAAVAAPLASPLGLNAGSIGMIAVEVLADGTHNHPLKAAAVKQLVPRLSELVTTASVEMQKFFPRDWA
jgi:hypothetical protein